MARRDDGWRKWSKLVHVSWGTLIGAGLLIIVAVGQIGSRGVHSWFESDSALLFAIGAILIGLYDRLHFLNRQACEVTDIIDAITTDPDNPEQGPFFSMADAGTVREKLGLSLSEEEEE